MRSRPMHAMFDHEAGCLWFITDHRGAKDDEIRAAANVCLAFADTHSNTYLSISGRAEMVHDIADLEFGLAEDFVLGLADEQPGQLEDVAINGLADARCEGLRLLFLFGGEGGARHGDLGSGGFCFRQRFPRFVYKNSTNTAAAHTARSGRRFFVDVNSR